MEHLGRAIIQRTGLQGESPLLDGVLTTAKMSIHDKSVSELHKVHHAGKTQPARYGQVPYSGPKY